MTPIEFNTRSVEETESLGRALGALLQPGDVIALSGPLGAGKTALTRGIGAGWGTREPITSPTFTLIHEHHRAGTESVLYHVDCYRLAGDADAATIGLEDMLHGEDIVVLEWPENVEAVLPPDRLGLTLHDVGGTQRRIEAHATGTRYANLLAALCETWGAAQTGRSAGC